MLSAGEWVKKASKIKAKKIPAFIAESRADLKIFPETHAIYAELDWNKIDPLQALAKLQTVLLKPAIREAQAKEKNWIARVYSGGECIREESFHLSHEADRWIDLRLFEASSDSYGEVSSFMMKGIQKIYRQDAIARIMQKPAPTACKLTHKGSSKLSWGPKTANQKKFYFSRG